MGTRGSILRLRGLLFLSYLFITTPSPAGFVVIHKDKAIPLTINKTIEFCWVTAESTVTRQLQKSIEAHLYEQIHERAGIDIQFVGNCLQYYSPMNPVGISFFDAIDNPLGIQAEINNIVLNQDAPGHPTTYSKGVWVQKNLTDIVLTSRFQNVNDSLLNQAQPLSIEGRHNLLLSIALHEVLHAFGIGHEHDRPDAFCQDQKTVKYDSKKHNLIGNYDSESIMNYCKTHHHNFEEGPISLSLGDIKTLHWMYLIRTEP